ncbi:MAG TPA: RNA polymerase sigma factor [Verrucomicrobiae bacterium]
MAFEGEEAEWVRRSRAGDTEAFAALVGRYQQMIDALTWRMTGSLADAQDLAQETFIQAYHSLDQFEDRSKFSTWLYQIAVNKCLNWRKAMGRRSQAHEKWATEAEHEATRRSHSAGDGNSAQGDAVQKALLKLPAEQRAAIVLTVYEEMNHAEAARVLGCSETTVSWRIFMARRKLKQWLKDLMTEEEA